jgi:hypothetical protein
MVLSGRSPCSSTMGYCNNHNIQIETTKKKIKLMIQALKLNSYFLILTKVTFAQWYRTHSEF